MKIIEGDFATPKGRFAIVAGRFNGFVVEPLSHRSCRRTAALEPAKSFQKAEFARM